MKKISIALVLSCVLSSNVFSQDFKMPAPSPATTIKQDFSTSFIELSYSRPSVKGRKIFGDVVPLGKEWRTGANAATKITFNEEVIFGDQMVPAGTYAIYTIPYEGYWVIMLNKGTENWGLTGYDSKMNIATIKSPVKHNDNKLVETFTISFDNMTKNTCDLTFAWEKINVSVPIVVKNEERIEAYLKKALEGDKPPYLTAAQYYLEKEKNLDNALDYANKAIKENPKAFYIHSVKAQILNKLGKKAEAIKEAKIAADAAVGTPYEAEYLQKYKLLNGK